MVSFRRVFSRSYRNGHTPVAVSLTETGRVSPRRVRLPALHRSNRRTFLKWVTAARTLPNYRLWVCFDDGVEGEVDLHDFVMSDQRPIVAALRAPGDFAAIRVEHDTVVWENGFDLAPEYLRANLRTRARA